MQNYEDCEVILERSKVVEDIRELQSKARNFESQLIDANADKRRMARDLEEFTRTEFESGDLTDDQASALADIGGFSLDRTYEVEASITVRYDITVPLGVDIEDAIAETNFGTDDITNYSHDIDNVNTEVEYQTAEEKS